MEGLVLGLHGTLPFRLKPLAEKHFSIAASERENAVRAVFNDRGRRMPPDRKKRCRFGGLDAQVEPGHDGSGEESGFVPHVKWKLKS